MKTILKVFLPLAIVCCGLSESYAYYASVNGPSYTCPDSELAYYYSDDFPAQWVTFTITNGKIYNIFSLTWENVWTFSRSSYTYLNNTYPFRIKWDNSALGTVGNVHVKICNNSCAGSVQGSRNVTFGGDPANPTISGDSYILNCLSQQKNYSAINIPQNWNLVDWTFSTQIQQFGGTVNSNPVTVDGVNTTFTGNQTLTGVFHFITDGKNCATKYVNKNIWVGAPNPTNLTLNGSPYSGGGGDFICGDSWVGIEYSTPVSSTAWSFDPSMSYYYSDAGQCNFNVDYGSPSSWRISAVGTNACGAGYTAFYYLGSSCWGFMISAYPNPASDELTIDTSSLNKKEANENSIVASEVLLFDKSGSKLLQVYPTESTVKLDTRNIPAGEYLLHIKIDDEIIKRHILINK